MKKKEKYCKLKNCDKEDRSWTTETGAFTVIPGTIGKIISMSAFSGQCRVLWFGYPLSYNGSPFEGWQVSKKNIKTYQNQNKNEEMEIAILMNKIGYDENKST